MSGNPFEDDEDPMLAFGASGQNETPFSNPGAGNMDAMEALANVGPPPQRGSRTPGDIASVMAMLADAFLNKGRTIGPLLGQLASRQDPAIDNYKLRMDDAMKRAQIQRMLAQGHGDPEQVALRREALRLQESGQQIQREALAARTNGVPGIRDALKAMGGVDPAVIDGMTDAQANALKGALTAQMRQSGSNAAWAEREGARRGEWDRRTGVTEQNKVGAETRAVGREVAKEGREQGRQVEQLSIPGWRPIGTPSKETSSAGREIVDALGEVEYAAGELTKLHKELGAQAALGKLNSFVGSDEAAAAISRAKLLHQKLIAGERRLQNMGVPQEYELKMLTGAEPELDSIDGIMRAGSVYPAVSAEAKSQAVRRMRVHNFEPDTGGPVRSPGGLGTTGSGRGRFDGVPPIPDAKASSDDDEWEDL